MIPRPRRDGVHKVVVMTRTHRMLPLVALALLVTGCATARTADAGRDADAELEMADDPVAPGTSWPDLAEE